MDDEPSGFAKKREIYSSVNYELIRTEILAILFWQLLAVNSYTRELMWWVNGHIKELRTHRHKHKHRYGYKYINYELTLQFKIKKIRVSTKDTVKTRNTNVNWV